MLLEGREPSSDLLRFIKALKTKTSRLFESKTGTTLWQKKFYDHILRRNDSPDPVAWYIWTNPVRAGLSSRPEDYPFLGSLTGLWPKAPACARWRPPWKNNSIGASHS
jgi:REP element-mobilizing transposase RayT